MLKLFIHKMSFSEAACSEEHNRGMQQRRCAASVIAAYFHVTYCVTSAAPNSRMRLASAGRPGARQPSPSLTAFCDTLVSICEASAAIGSATHLPRWPDERSAPRLGPPPPSTPSTLLVETTFPNAHVMNIFGCFLQAISDQNKCTCTFFVPPPPPQPHSRPITTLPHTHPLLQLQLPQDG